MPSLLRDGFLLRPDNRDDKECRHGCNDHQTTKRFKPKMFRAWVFHSDSHRWITGRSAPQLIGVPSILLRNVEGFMAAKRSTGFDRHDASDTGANMPTYPLCT
jgi:hypothetical protein